MAALAALGFCATIPALRAGLVQVKEEPNAITFSNGVVTAVIDAGRAEVSSITLAGARGLLSPKGITFDAEGFGIGKNQTGLHGGNFRLAARGPERAEIVFTDPNFLFMTAEMHLVMGEDDPGIYQYLVLKHGKGQPAGSVGQLRWVFRGNKQVLTHAYASASKQGQMIGNMTDGEIIGDVTHKLPKNTSYHEPTGHTLDGSPVYTKYDWTDYVENHVVHGFSSDQEGIWIVQPSMEYCNGGPTKGVLTVHDGPVCILEFLGGHFLIRDNISIHLKADEEWQQIIGPWFVYLNKANGLDALWRDAEQRGRQEKAAWPYAWVQEKPDVYPIKRGTVAGTISLPGNASTANALVVLGAPDRDWQTQAMRYLFWTRADAAGRFSIPKVRPGTYTLYASVPGTVGEIKLPEVQVAADQTRNLGTLRWNPPRLQNLLWRVGTPDRTTGEFRFGREPRQFGLWWRYLAEMGSKELTYTVGRSQPDKDWYYAQTAVPMEDGSYLGPRWNIRFNLPRVEPGKLRLTVDLAGAAGDSHLDIEANGKNISRLSPPNDSGVYRSAVLSANFRHHVIEFDANALHPGENTISFVLDTKGANWREKGGPAAKRPEFTPGGVMYDCIQLESGPVVGDGSCQIVPPGK